MYARPRSAVSVLALAPFVLLAGCRDAPLASVDPELAPGPGAASMGNADPCEAAAAALMKGAQDLRVAAVNVRRACDDGPCEPEREAAETAYQALVGLYAEMVDACSPAPPPATCGNGVLEGAEECDDGNTQSGDGCSDACILEAPPQVCGDNVVSGDEECDDGNAQSGDGCSFECTLEEGSPDVCDGLDNDFDPGTADGSADPLVGTACDGPDSDLCTEGVWECTGGNLVCSDATGDDVEVCDGLDNDCDGQTDEGLLNTNPSCGSASFGGALEGDQNAQVIQVSDVGESWVRFTVVEGNGGFSLVDLAATVELLVPSGADYDLHVYCQSCGGTLIGSSTNGGSLDERVDVRADDDIGVDDGFDILVEVRFVSASACAPWTLRIRGNTVVGPAAGSCE